MRSPLRIEDGLQPFPLIEIEMRLVEDAAERSYGYLVLPRNNCSVDG